MIVDFALGRLISKEIPTQPVFKSFNFLKSQATLGCVVLITIKTLQLLYRLFILFIKENRSTRQDQADKIKVTDGQMRRQVCGAACGIWSIINAAALER